MALVLNQQQRLIQQTASSFLTERSPVSAFRALRDNHRYYDPNLWAEMVAMGWSGALVPKSCNGLELDLTTCGLIAIETSKTLTMSPFVTSSVTAVYALLQCADSAQRNAYLSAIAEGSVKAVVAQYNEHNEMLIANLNSADILLIADSLLGGSAGLRVVKTADVATTIETLGLIDSHNYALLSSDSIDSLQNKGDALQWSNSDQALQSIANVSATMAAAELYGCAQEAFNRTLTYLHEREQFGQKIGQFQALQHRAAKMYVELELLKTVVFDALGTVPKDNISSNSAASQAKAIANDTARLVTTEAIQMHGGIGLTDELDIGLFYKRARVLQTLYGNSDYHRLAYAKFKGF